MAYKCSTFFVADAKTNTGKLNLGYFVILVNKEQFPVKIPHDKALSAESYLDLSHADRLSADSAISSSKSTVNSAAQ